MARTVSSKVRKHVQSEIDPLVKVFLITIRHKDLTEPIRVSSDPTERVDADSINVIYGTVSRGLTFYYAGFEAALVSDEEGAAPQTQLSLPNADRKLVEAIESMGGKGKCYGPRREGNFSRHVFLHVSAGGKNNHLRSVKALSTGESGSRTVSVTQHSVRRRAGPRHRLRHMLLDDKVKAGVTLIVPRFFLLHVDTNLVNDIDDNVLLDIPSPL